MNTVNLDRAAAPGIIFVEGVEARACAQRLHQRLTPNNEHTVTLIEPGPKMSRVSGAHVEELAHDGTVILVAHPLWSQVTMWQWTDRAHLALHASHGNVMVTRQRNRPPRITP